MHSHDVKMCSNRKYEFGNEQKKNTSEGRERFRFETQSNKKKRNQTSKQRHIVPVGLLLIYDEIQSVQLSNVYDY